MKMWAADDLDEILNYGDFNYRKQMSQFRCDTVIKPPQINFKVYISRAKIFTEIGACTMKGIFDPESTKSLIDHINKVLQDYDCIIFTYCEQSYAIWKEKNAFYIFNSEDTDENGKLTQKTRGACCAIRSTSSIQNIVDYLVEILRFPKKRYEIYSFKVNKSVTIDDHKKLAGELYNNGRSEGEVSGQPSKASVAKSHKSEKRSDDNLLDYNLFTTTNDVRSIRANEVKTIEWSQENIPFGVCYAIAMLCTSRSLDSEFYTRDIIDRIILFGNELMAQCEEICHSDFDLCNQKMCPDELNWNFDLNNVRTNIQMDVYQRGILTTQNLSQTIEEFFTFYSVGVLVTSSFVVAVWKDSDEYFIFYSHSIDEVGKITKSRRVTSDTNAPVFPGLVVFKTTNNLTQNIMSNVNEAQQCKPFELRICNIVMTELCEEPVEANCDSVEEKLTDENLINPAISADVELTADLTTTSNTSISEDLRKLVKQIIARQHDAPGFIPFRNGEVICGRLSKTSKRLNKTARKYHVSVKSILCRQLVKMSLCCFRLAQFVSCRLR